MPALLAASLIWAFSFGLIKTQLAGVPSHLVAFLRLALSALLFVPWFRPRRIGGRALALLAVIGTVQYGAMYLAYLASFRYLKASEVALWTIFTPICVVLIADAAGRTFRRRNLAAAALSVLAAWLVSPSSGGTALAGIALVQISNLCFATGQVWYPRLVPISSGVRDHEIFAALYFGGSLLAAIPVAVDSGTMSAMAALTLTQIATICYLGLIPSGLGFFLWNAGVRRSREGTAAVLNNAKVPLAILVSWLLFEHFPALETLARTLLALGLITAALWLAESGTTSAVRKSPEPSEPAHAERD
jgi:drug/metabolite transporter (DMT)-like permease